MMGQFPPTVCGHHSWALSFLGEGSVITSLLSPVSQGPGPKGLSLMSPGDLVRPGSTLFQEWRSGEGMARGVNGVLLRSVGLQGLDVAFSSRTSLPHHGERV